MAGNTKEERGECIGYFPDLETDGSFVVNSDPNFFYNCIGFAIGYEDVWVAPSQRGRIPWFWWPETVAFNDLPGSLIATFQYFDFEICTNDLPEEGFDKVALYSKDGHWKHAARIIGENLYHSKLGESYDIFHRGGDVLNRSTRPEDSYGEPFIFMRRRVEDKTVLTNKRPPCGYMKWSGNTFYYMAPSPLRNETIQRIINGEYAMTICHR